ncbi:metallophosphoesterase family protein [Rhodospirillum centenum]|uniref:Ser n=1 Tax=Rhodospirillum centenum (strain ATCC 51521 / SW) TaxID=414684 RepID=B6IX00_RHOCS|nr:metallophosphoesterase family protein [Rhodospirillum centenum]ACJ00824.1 Ser [Rhodospirillum centenum SW]
MIGSWFRRQTAKPPPRIATVPEGQRLYAIGDIHGRADLLDRLLERIRADAAAAPELQHTLVLLGDYVDRGLDSAGVVERLAGGPPPGFGMICLKGNHEDALLRFLEDPGVGVDWMRFGGLATLMSYGVRRRDALPETVWLEEARLGLRERLPRHHLAFLTTLRTHVAVGGYLFVHAGIRPGRPLDDQEEDDMLWIRDAFLASSADHGALVVHGHSISETPDVQPNRIGIDTGAYVTGRLTALVLEKSDRRFIVT